MIEVDSRELSAFYRAVRNMDKAAARQLNKRIRAAAQPIMEEVKAAALGLPSGSTVGKVRRAKGAEGLGLRQGIAAAVELKVNNPRKGASVRIRVSGTKFNAATDKGRKLPRYVEGLTRRPWRHPVFGNRNVWVAQEPKPFLLRTVLPHKPVLAGVIVQEYRETYRNEVQARGIRVTGS